MVFDCHYIFGCFTKIKERKKTSFFRTIDDLQLLLVNMFSEFHFLNNSLVFHISIKCRALLSSFYWCIFLWKTWMKTMWKRNCVCVSLCVCATIIKCDIFFMYSLLLCAPENSTLSDISQNFSKEKFKREALQNQTAINGEANCNTPTTLKKRNQEFGSYPVIYIKILQKLHISPVYSAW